MPKVAPSAPAIACSALLALAGCASLVGIDDFGPDDAGVGRGDDARGDDGLPPPGDAPAAITIIGTAHLDPATAAATTIANSSASFTRDGDPPISTFTDATGTFRFDFVTDGTAVSGFVDVRSTAAIFQPRRYLFDVVGDQQIAMTGLTVPRMQELASFAQASQSVTTGCIFVVVRDAVGGQKLSGATVDAQGLGTLRYHSDQNNLPGTDRSSTGASGAAWVFAVPPGSVTLTATLGTRRVTRTLEVPAMSVVSSFLDLP